MAAADNSRTITRASRVGRLMLVANNKISMLCLSVFLVRPSMNDLHTMATVKQVQKKMMTYCDGTNSDVIFNTITLIDIRTIIVLVVEKKTVDKFP